MANKKLYLVKKEVYAESVEEAIRLKGNIVEVSIADEKYQPQAPLQKVGY